MGKRNKAAQGRDIPCAPPGPTDEKIGNLGRQELKSGMGEVDSYPNSKKRKMQRLKTELKSIFLRFVGSGGIFALPGAKISKD